MSQDPRETIAERPMHGLQIAVVALCIALNALDGFDVLAISFAAPGIAADWGVDRTVLGVVLSMELFGMAAGSVIIGNIADRIGRRPTILGCLAVMAVGMFLAAGATSVANLSVIRFLTGLGIGGMISTTSAMVAEFSNNRRRDLNMTLNIAGYSGGAIVGGIIASMLLARTGEWRSVFLFGGIFTLVLTPLAVFFLPESIDSQIARRPANALAKVNRLLGRLDLPALSHLPPAPAKAPKPSIASLFSPEYAPLTLLLTVAYFAQIMAFYYIQKWTPKVIVDMGFEASQAGGVLVFANVGGLLGAICLGLASQRFRLRPVIIGAMAIAFLAISSYGVVRHDLTQLAVIAGIAGFFTNGGVVGLYPILARTFPATLRASGTGFVIGVGRGGSAVGPVVAGALFATGANLLVVSATLGAGALLATLMLLILPLAQRLSERARTA